MVEAESADKAAAAAKKVRNKKRADTFIGTLTALSTNLKSCHVKGKPVWEGLFGAQ